MVMGAVDSMIGTIPVVIAGGITMKFAEQAFPKPKKAVKRKTRKKAKRSKSKKKK